MRSVLGWFGSGTETRLNVAEARQYHVPEPYECSYV